MTAVAAVGWIVIVLGVLYWCARRDQLEARRGPRPFDWERDAPWLDDEEEAA